MQHVAIAALLLRVTGDAAAFEAALGPLLDQAHRLATGMLHDSALGEDAVQEAAVKAWRKLDRLRPGSDMRPWFLAIVANECRNVLRSRWRRSVVALDSDRLAAGQLEDAAVTEHDTRRALMALRYKDRLVVVLHFYLDLPVEDLARVLDISPAAAKARLYRAIEHLRRQVGDAEGRP